MKKIMQGDTFEHHTDTGRRKRIDTFRRETDDPAPRFECERIRVTHLASSYDPKMTPYTFGTEPEWFKQRGLEAG